MARRTSASNACIEGLVVVILLAADSNFHLEPTGMGICGEGTKGAKRGGVA